MIGRDVVDVAYARSMRYEKERVEISLAEVEARCTVAELEVREMSALHKGCLRQVTSSASLDMMTLAESVPQRRVTTHLAIETSCGGATHFFILSTLRARCDTQVISVCPLTNSLIYTGTRDLDLFASETAALDYITRTRGLSVVQQVRAVGIAGYVGGRLALVTASKLTAVLPCGSEVYTVTASRWLLIPTAHALHRPASYARDTELLGAFPLSDAHFYCETLNLTTVYPPQDRTLPSSVPRTSAPQGDLEFHWNRDICGDFIALGLEAWCVQLLQGYAEARALPVEEGGGAQEHLCIIAKKSKHHPGPRYIARGLGDDDYPANEVEVQILVWREDDGALCPERQVPAARLGSPPLTIPVGQQVQQQQQQHQKQPSVSEPHRALGKNEQKCKELMEILLQDVPNETSSCGSSTRKPRDSCFDSSSDSDSESGSDVSGGSSGSRVPPVSPPVTRKRAGAEPPKTDASPLSGSSSSSDAFAQIVARHSITRDPRSRSGDDASGMSYTGPATSPRQDDSEMYLAVSEQTTPRPAVSFATHVFRRGTIPLRWGTELQGGAGRAVGKANIVLDSDPTRGAGKYFEYLGERFPEQLITVVSLLHSDQDHSESPLSQAYTTLVSEMNANGIGSVGGVSPLTTPLSARVHSAAHAAASAGFILTGGARPPPSLSMPAAVDPPAPRVRSQTIHPQHTDGAQWDFKRNNSMRHSSPLIEPPSLVDSPPRSDTGRVRMVHFDWHKTTKNHGLDGAPGVFWAGMSKHIEAQRYTSGVLRGAGAAAEADLVSHQQGICRINCADSLDRTNGCAFLIEVQVAGEMLRQLRRASEERGRGSDPPAPDTVQYRELRSVAEAKAHLGDDTTDVLVDFFVNCGDLLSELYTGTHAAFSDIIRQFASVSCPARHSNTMLSVLRRYQNVVSDAWRADSFSTFLCRRKHPVPRLMHIPHCFAIRSSPPLPLDMLGDTGRQVWEIPNNAALFSVVVSLPPLPRAADGTRSRVSHVALCLRSCGTSLTPGYFDVYAGMRLDQLHPILTGVTMPVTEDMTWALYHIPDSEIAETARLVQLTLRQYQGCEESGMCIGEIRVLCEVPSEGADSTAVMPLWSAQGAACSASVPRPLCYCSKDVTRNMLCYPGSYVAQVSPQPDHGRDPNCILDRYPAPGDIDFALDGLAPGQRCARLLFALADYTIAQSVAVRCSVDCTLWLGMGLTEDNLTHSGTVEVRLRGGFRRNSVPIGGRGLRVLFCKFSDVRTAPGDSFVVRRIELYGTRGMLPGNCGWLPQTPSQPHYTPVAKCTQAAGAAPASGDLPPGIELRLASKMLIPALRFKPVLTGDDVLSQVKRVRVSIYSHAHSDPTLTLELTLPLTMVTGANLDYRVPPTRGIRVRIDALETYGSPCRSLGKCRVLTHGR